MTEVQNQLELTRLGVGKEPSQCHFIIQTLCRTGLSTSSSVYSLYTKLFHGRSHILHWAKSISVTSFAGLVDYKDVEHGDQVKLP